MYPCTGCGLCCKHIGSISELKDYDLGNGVCKYLDVLTNSCVIYDTRPDICRVDKMFDDVYHEFFSKRDFYVKNAEACNSLQLIHKIDKSYKLNIKEI